MARILPGPKTVSQLKNSILHPSTTSNYICQFTIPSDGDFNKHMKNRLGGLYNNSDNQEKLQISCSEASLPGSSLATYDIDNAFHGVSEKIAYRKIYDDRIDFTFIVDRNYFNIRFFESWIAFIAGEDKPFALLEQINQNYSYRANYAKKYRTDNLYITKFEKNYDGPVLTYKFIGAYPLSVVSMPVSYDQSQLLKCTVSFTYLRYVINPLGEETFDGIVLPDPTLGAPDLPSSVDLGFT